MEAEAAPPGHRRRLGLRRLLPIAAVLLFVGLLAYGVIANAPNTTIDSRLSKHEAAKPPDFDLAVLQPGTLGPTLTPKLAPALRNGRVSLSELRGVPVVLNFWASWCIPCRQEAPVLEAAWERERRAGVLFLGLNMQDATSDARAFIRKYHDTYLNIRDQGGGVAHDWGVTGVPETFFISPAGLVVSHVIGVVDQDQLTGGIAAAQSGRPLGSSEGGARRPTQ